MIEVTFNFLYQISGQSFQIQKAPKEHNNVKGRDKLIKSLNYMRKEENIHISISYHRDTQKYGHT